MSTQRRVVRWQRLSNTRFAGAGNPPSHDAGAPGQQQEFRRVANGLEQIHDNRALKSFVQSIDFLRKSIRYECGSGNMYRGFAPTASASTFLGIELATNSLSFNSCCEWRFCHWNSSRTASLDFSPPIRCFRAGIASARTMQSALPQVPTGVCPGTERQHGQGNLYLQHAARNAACDFGRRSARRDLLRA
jgi:hypothetical protein